MQIEAMSLDGSLTPLEFFWGMDSHSPGFLAPEVIFDRSDGAFTRVDGGNLPAPMTAPKSRRISVEELRALGCTVHEVDCTAAFLDWVCCTVGSAARIGDRFGHAA